MGAMLKSLPKKCCYLPEYKETILVLFIYNFYFHSFLYWMNFSGYVVFLDVIIFNLNVRTDRLILIFKKKIFIDILKIHNTTVESLTLNLLKALF